MRNLAAVFLDGYLTSTPELRKTPNGKNVTTFSIAVNHDFNKDNSGEGVSFIEIEAWEKLAQNCVQYLEKGRKVTVQGDIRQVRWKSPDGVSRQKIKVVAASIRFDSKPNPEKKEVQAA